MNLFKLAPYHVKNLGIGVCIVGAILFIRPQLAYESMSVDDTEALKYWLSSVGLFLIAFSKEFRETAVTDAARKYAMGVTLIFQTSVILSSELVFNLKEIPERNPCFIVFISLIIYQVIFRLRIWGLKRFGKLQEQG